MWYYNKVENESVKLIWNRVVLTEHHQAKLGLCYYTSYISIVNLALDE